LKASTLIDLEVTKLIDIPQVFSRLDPKVISRLMSSSVNASVLGGLCPNPFLRFFLKKASKNVIANIENIADFRNIAISGLTYDPATLG
jgi:hypothetical protein